MKNVLFVFAAAFISANVAAQCSDSLTAKDYAHAEQFLSYNTSKHVEQNIVYSKWISNDSMWYAQSKNGGYEFVIVDAPTGKKSVVSRESLPRESEKFNDRNA